MNIKISNFLADINILSNFTISTSNDDSNLIFLFLLVVVSVSIALLLIRIVPLIKYLLIDDIKKEEAILVMKRTIQTLKKGKKIRLEPISEKLRISQIETLKLLKSSIPTEMKQKNLLVSTFPSFSLISLPIKGQVCAICLNPIEVNVYLQCLSCTRFFCLNHDYKKIEEVNTCPECTGILIFFPKCCNNCGLEFATLSHLPDLEKCPFCRSDKIISPFQAEVLDTIQKEQFTSF